MGLVVIAVILDEGGAAVAVVAPDAVLGVRDRLLGQEAARLIGPGGAAALAIDEEGVLAAGIIAIGLGAAPGEGRCGLDRLGLQDLGVRTFRARYRARRRPRASIISAAVTASSGARPGSPGQSRTSCGGHRLLKARKGHLQLSAVSQGPNSANPCDRPRVPRGRGGPAIGFCYRKPSSLVSRRSDLHR
jgi:hypothetical protein